jgi:hypothetical protein
MSTNKRKIKMAKQISPESNNKKRQIGGTVLALGLGVATILTAGGCNNSTGDDTKPCTCPNNTVHNSPCTCSGVDCTCESKKLNWNITLVDNTTGGVVTADHIRLINSKLSELTGESYAAAIQARNDVVLLIIDGNTASVLDLSTIAIGADFFSLYTGTLGVALDAQIAKLDAGIIGMNRFNPSVRLANGKNQFSEKLALQANNRRIVQVIRLGRQYNGVIQEPSTEFCISGGKNDIFRGKTSNPV